MWTNVLFLALGVTLGVVGHGLLVSGWIFPPLRDPGHRLYGVSSEKAAAVVLDIFSLAGFNPKLSFDDGPTHQVVVNDGQRTVVAWFDDTKESFPHNGPSFTVADPTVAAHKAVQWLRRAGFAAEKMEMPIGNGGILYMITSDAFEDFVIIFRQPWYKLGIPKRRALPQR